VNVVLSSTTVGVFGSGIERHEALANDVGRALAEMGVNLLTGGGGGVMASVSEAFTQARRAKGVCIGIIPCESERDRGTPKRGYPNRFVELAIHTHLPFSGEQGTDDLSRNHINVLSCAASVALPGGAGTAAEVALAIRYGRPVIAYAPDPSLIQHFPDAVARVDSIEHVTRFLRIHLER
jgi:uncharacterized protein (TIGR00725 family)